LFVILILHQKHSTKKMYDILFQNYLIYSITHKTSNLTPHWPIDFGEVFTVLDIFRLRQLLRAYSSYMLHLSCLLFVAFSQTASRLPLSLHYLSKYKKTTQTRYSHQVACLCLPIRPTQNPTGVASTLTPLMCCDIEQSASMIWALEQWAGTRC
jgi:hypothetical protein